VQHGNPFDAIGNLLEMYKLDHCPAPVPFLGGAVGYFSYDLCHFIERLPSTAIDDLKPSESYFAFYDAIMAFDHLQGRAYIVATGFPETEEGQRLSRARMRLEEMKDWLYAASPSQEASPPRRERLGEGEFQPIQENRRVLLKSNFTPEEYIKAVDRVREYIATGDVFQVNLSQRFEADLKIPPYGLHKRLRMVNPTPFASYLNFQGVTIVSASPERFLKVQGDLVETRPIKGTRPRGRDPVGDARLAQELTHSIKDRAENVMIVDLERCGLWRLLMSWSRPREASIPAP